MVEQFQGIFKPEDRKILDKELYKKAKEIIGEEDEFKYDFKLDNYEILESGLSRLNLGEFLTDSIGMPTLFIIPIAIKFKTEGYPPKTTTSEGFQLTLRVETIPDKENLLCHHKELGLIVNPFLGKCVFIKSSFKTESESCNKEEVIVEDLTIEPAREATRKETKLFHTILSKII